MASLITWKKIIGYSIELGDAIKNLHDKNLIHHDIKCSNILIEDENCSIKLIDYEFVTPTKNNHKNCGIGTPGYSPPDNVCSTKLDIFSMGIVLGKWTFGEKMINSLRSSENRNHILSCFTELKNQSKGSNLESPLVTLLNLINNMLDLSVERRANISQVTETLSSLKLGTNSSQRNFLWILDYEIF